MAVIPGVAELLRRLTGRRPAEPAPHPEPAPKTPPDPPGSADCAECARLWAASGYDPAVRCAEHAR